MKRMNPPLKKQQGVIRESVAVRHGNGPRFESGGPRPKRAVPVPRCIPVSRLLPLSGPAAGNEQPRGYYGDKDSSGNGSDRQRVLALGGRVNRPEVDDCVAGCVPESSIQDADRAPPEPS